MQITQTGAVTTCAIDIATEGHDHWFLLQSDNHHDHPTCNRQLELEHLEEARQRHAQVFIFGDLFDGMQGRFDPRRSYNELRPEYRRDDYYDFLVKDFTDFFRPFVNNLAMISDGNHELAVLKAANTNLTDRLVDRLRLAGSHVVHGGYGGWVRFMFHRDGKPFNGIRLKFFHGAGGEAPVTRGAIQTNRQAVYLPDADIVVNGHSHNSYHIPISRERLSGKGRQFFDIQHHIRTPGYKQSYGDGSAGWDVTRGGPPKPIGACWLNLRVVQNSRSDHEQADQIKIIVIPAIQGADVVTIGGDLYQGVEFGEDDRMD